MFPEAVKYPQMNRRELARSPLNSQDSDCINQGEFGKNKPIPQGPQTFPGSAFNDYDILLMS